VSVGAAPMSDEDLLALRQPPSIVPAPDPVVEGPSPTPPDFIDQVNAQPLAAPVSGAAPDENAFPPPVPPEAPGMVPMPPPLPGAPPAPGAKPPGTPGAPASPKDALAQADQDVRDAATGAATAREKADQAQITAAEGGADEAHAAHNAAIDALANRQDEIDRTEKLQAQYEEADKRAQQAVDEAAKARKNFSFRSYWADKSSATRIASALFQALGAFGAGLTRGPNYALQILDKDMDDDHRMQVERLQQLSDDEVRARTGLADSREARKQALLQIQTNAAQGDAMIAAQLRAASAKSTDDNFKKNVDAFAAKLQQDSAQKLLEARAAVRNGIIKEQDDAAKRKEQEARTNLYNAQAAKARGHAGGGGAGGGEAYDAFREAVLAGAPNVGELAARAGIKPSQIADQVEKIRTESDKEAAAKNKGAGKSGLDETRVVRLVDGTEAGMAPTARAVPQIQKELKTLPRAIEQLKQLREASFVSPRDPRFHNAVLAVAATTSAGSTDANVTHEKGTLTNALGLPDNDAIDRKIAELENQLQASKDQLEPLPEGYTPHKRLAPGAATGAPGSSGASAGGPKTPKLPPGLPEGSQLVGPTKDGRTAYRLPSGKLVAQ